MIIGVKQRNESKQFYLDFTNEGNIINSCSQSSFTNIGKIKLNDLLLCWDWQKEVKAKIPFKKFLGGCKKNYRTILEKSKKIGAMYTFLDLSKAYFTINYKGITLTIYRKVAGKIFFSIYLKNIQIASIVKDNLVTDALDTYTIFILDEYKQYLNVIMLFNGYIDNYYYGHKRGAFYGISYNNINADSNTDEYFNEKWYDQFEIDNVLQSVTWTEAKEKIKNYKRM